MRLSLLALAAGVVPFALAHPLEKRENALPPVNSAVDESVLQLVRTTRPITANDDTDVSQALYLEHLELSLYTGGFNNFTDAEYEAAGFPPGFRENVGIIAEVHLILHAEESHLTDSFVIARECPCLNVSLYLDQGRLLSNTMLPLLLSLHRPGLIRRLGEYDHICGHWCLSRRCITTYG